jgi:hypothetical protein
MEAVYTCRGKCVMGCEAQRTECVRDGQQRWVGLHQRLHPVGISTRAGHQHLRGWNGAGVVSVEVRLGGVDVGPPGHRAHAHNNNNNSKFPPRNSLPTQRRWHCPPTTRARRIIFFYTHVPSSVACALPLTMKHTTAANENPHNPPQRLRTNPQRHMLVPPDSWRVAGFVP